MKLERIISLAEKHKDNNELSVHLDLHDMLEEVDIGENYLPDVLMAMIIDMDGTIRKLEKENRVLRGESIEEEEEDTQDEEDGGYIDALDDETETWYGDDDYCLRDEIEMREQHKNKKAKNNEGNVAETNSSPAIMESENLSENRNDAIRKLNMQGYSSQEIAEKLGLSKSTVWRALKG